MKNFVQISCKDADASKCIFNFSIANISRQTSYFEQNGGIQFEVLPDDDGLGDAIMGILRFSSGDLAIIGTRPSTRSRGVQLICESEAAAGRVLSAFKEAFPDITDAEMQIHMTRA